MPRRNLAFVSLLIVAALILPFLLGPTTLTQADPFASLLAHRDYLPLIQSGPFESPLPTPPPSLYLPLLMNGE
jgi:hypothetical protein